MLHSKVVINEFSYDDSGGDDCSFIELYNSGSEPVPMNGWRMEVGGAVEIPGDNGVEISYNFPADLVLAPGQYLVLGTNEVESGRINVDYFMAPGTTLVMRNYKSFATLYSDSSTIADSVVWFRSEKTPGFPVRYIPAGHGEPASDGVTLSGGGIRGALITSQINNENSRNLATSTTNNSWTSSLTFQRNPDPFFIDSDDNDNDFFLATATPGARNYSQNRIEKSVLDSEEIVFNFDEDAPKIEKRLGGSYFDMYVQDPTVAAGTLDSTGRSGNPYIIPPSPQGGNVGIHWNHLQDVTVLGHGVQGVLSLKDPVADIEIETYVYIGRPFTPSDNVILPDSTNVGIGEAGSFIIARGRPDSHPMGHNRFPFYSHSNSDTGIRLHYRNNVSNSGKYLVRLQEQLNGITTDLSDEIEITTPGWYRILFSVRGDKVMAIIGGEFGNYTAADGTLVNGIRLPANSGEYYTTTITRPGNVGYNYHAFLALDNEGKRVFRPTTFDKLTYRKPTVIPSSSVDSWKIY